MPPKNNTRKLEILQVTDQLFRQGMGQDVTIEDVARVAGISKGTVYLYFDTKEELFFRAELYRMEHLVATLRSRVDWNAEFFDRLVVAFQCIEDFFKDRVPILRVHQFIRSAPGPETKKRQREWRMTKSILDKYLTGLMEEGIAEGIIRSDVKASVASRQLMALIKSRRMDMMSAQEFIPEVEEMLSLFVFGIVDATQKHKRLLARAEGHVTQ